MATIVPTIEAAKRKGKIMSEVLPTEEIWNAWVQNESRARQGKGYYPSLDRRFLEFLVSCEIDLLSFEHNLALEQPSDRIRPYTDKVRRVASQRIGNERLEAYRARVTEAFRAYLQGSVWATWDDDAVSVNSLEEEYEDKVEERGRDKATKEVQVTTHSQNQVSKQVERMEISVGFHMEVDVSAPGSDGEVHDDERRGKPVEADVESNKNIAAAVTSDMEVEHAL